MSELLELLKHAIDVFLHLDQYVLAWTQTFGLWLYPILFLVIFAETGLVVTPFLPGDSLLFAIGAITAMDGSPLSLPLVIVLLIVAGVLGDAVNYSVGRAIGPKVFSKEDSIWLNKKHLLRAQRFYENYGGKTIIFARFIPIVRTFAPFVAGIGEMRYRRFASFNVIGAITWVTLFTVAGHFFGKVPAVQKNFHYVILGIIVVSILPAVVEYFLERRRQRAAA
ncbi:MAG: DedA family protein [Myxococcota bacterium]